MTQDAPPLKAPAAPLPRASALRFHGSAAEYFRIWIVNLLLSIVTLGIYSAWAKVRRLRYFYRNTELRGDGFDYHAAPLKILAGRAIALVLLLFYANAERVDPVFGSIVAFALALGLFPWLLVRARMFHTRNTSYRNLRFGFAPAYKDAYRVFAGYGTLVGLSFGLAYPLFAYKRQELLVQNSRFGRTHFRLRGELRAYSAVHYKFAALMSALLLFWSVAPFGFTSFFVGDALWPLMLGLGVFSFCFAFAYLKAHTTNHIVSATRLGALALHSSLESRELALLYFTNLLAIVASAGLAIPWAQVRSYRYHVTHSALLASDELDAFTAAEHEDPAALGEEIGEFFDFDFGF